MKSLFKLTFSKVFFCAFIALVAMIVYSTVNGVETVSKSILPLCIPMFFVIYLVRNNYLNVAFILFLLFSFFAALSSMVFIGAMYLKVSSTLYLLGVLSLLGMAVPKLKIQRLDSIITAYLIVVFSITMFFFYLLFNALNFSISDRFEVLLFLTKSMALIALVFVAFGVYLSTQSKQSVIFLVCVTLVAFSSVLSYINLYMLYHWSFEMLGKILYVSSLYFLFRFMISENNNKKAIQKLKEKYISENIFA